MVYPTSRLRALEEKEPERAGPRGKYSRGGTKTEQAPSSSSRRALPGSSPCEISSAPTAPAATTAATPPSPKASSRLLLHVGRGAEDGTSPSRDDDTSRRRSAHRESEDSAPGDLRRSLGHDEDEPGDGGAGHVDGSGVEQVPRARTSVQQPDGCAGKEDEHGQAGDPGQPDLVAQHGGRQPDAADDAVRSERDADDRERAQGHPGELGSRKAGEGSGMSPVRRDGESRRPGERSQPAGDETSVRPRVPACARPAVAEVSSADEQDHR